MLSSITPFGERSRRSRWWLTVAAYVAGSVLAGALLGTVLGAVSMAARSVIGPSLALATLAVASLTGALMDAGRLPRRYPNWRRQVNEVWLTTYRGWAYGAGFGFQLGLGVVTIVTTSAIWLTWMAAALSGAWWRGLIIGATFGLTRSALILAVAHVDDPAALRRLHRRIARQKTPVQRLTVAFLTIAALTSLVAVLAA